MHDNCSKTFIPPSCFTIFLFGQQTRSIVEKRRSLLHVIVRFSIIEYKTWTFILQNSERWNISFLMLYFMVLSSLYRNNHDCVSKFYNTTGVRNKRNGLLPFFSRNCKTHWIVSHKTKLRRLSIKYSLFSNMTALSEKTPFPNATKSDFF